MCGHCTERAALAERLSMTSNRGGAHPDALLLPVHLQEADDWRRALMGSSGQDDLVIAIVALCRAWSERAIGNASTPLRVALGPPLHARLERWLASLDLPAAWTWLRTLDAGLPVPLQPETAREELDAYLAGWLHLQAATEPAWSEAMLHERLPRLSAALDLLCRDAPDDDRLVALALSSPGAASPFSAIDLWLQRRAMRAVISHRGMAFVVRLLERWRSGTLLAAVLHADLERDALLTLQAALSQRLDDGTEGTRDLRAAVALALAP